jgi:FO synthase
VLDRPLEELLSEALSLRSSQVVTYSRKVFIPLTKLCRDVCHYCTFARPPRRGERAYLTPDEVLDIARRSRCGLHRRAFHVRQRTTLYATPVDTSHLRSPKVLVRPGLAIA